MHDVVWYEVIAPFCAGFAARAGDVLAVCARCPILPVAVLRKSPCGAWEVIATPPALDVATLAACLLPRQAPQLRAA